MLIRNDCAPSRTQARMHYNKSLAELGKEAQDNKITSIIGLTLVCLASRRQEWLWFFFSFASAVVFPVGVSVSHRALSGSPSSMTQE
jgi:hypothetical protein